jgi:hypothetical protein
MCARILEVLTSESFEIFLGRRSKVDTSRITSSRGPRHVRQLRGTTKNAVVGYLLLLQITSV